MARVVRAPLRVILLSLAVALVSLLLAPGARAADNVFDPADQGVPDVDLAAAAAIAPSGFQQTTAITGLEWPMALRFAPDGRVFVAQKNGIIKLYDDVNDPTPTTYADLSTKVQDLWDRGLLGLALDPQFTTGRPFVYALYTHDAAIGGTAPRWGDDCPTPPGANDEGCVVSGRLSKLSGGSEQVLVEDWCQQFPSHSIGTVTFGSDGALYAGAGDGASFNEADYGQRGVPVNPCADPPGGTISPPAAEGGALRSQDARTSGDPQTLDGSIIRVNPDTGAALADNPNAASSDPNLRRIIAYGLRNPFRFTMRPGTTDIYLGDVGWNTWEEINRLPSPAAPVENFGWPCYEGNNRQSAYDGLNVSICENLYAAGAGAVTAPLYAYNHSAKVSTESCPTGGSALSGMAFYDGGTFPSQYNGALFFADYARSCIWVMFAGAGGVPDPATRQPFVTDAGAPVDLQVGPGGDLFYADAGNGTIQRIHAISSNHAPTARATANPTSGAAPLQVSFNASTSSDPDGDALSYAWDLDGDGQYDDSTSVSPTFTYTQAGTYTARVRASDPGGLSGTDSVTITAGTPPTPVIATPTAGTTWRVGDVISFSGSATRGQGGGNVPDSGLTWSIVMNHCSALVPTSCHEHVVQTVTGASGQFTAPNHDYPAYLELKLTATDGTLSSTVTRRLDPKTVDLSFESQPAGLALNVASEEQAAPFTRTVIQNSSVPLIAPTPQPLAGKSYAFSSWSDGGASAHSIVAPSSTTPATYRATYSEVACTTPANLAGAWGFDETTGPTTADASGNNNTGTISGATRTTSGRYGSALTFDGVNDIVNVADSASLDLTNRATLEAWVNPNALGSAWRTALLKEQPGQLVYALYANNDFSRPSGHLFTTSDLATTGTAPLALNTWTHLAMTWDGTTQRLFLNGVQVSSQAVSGTLVNSAGALRFGGNNVWTEWFSGALDEIRIYNRALTQAEVQADMTTPVTCSGTPPPQPALAVSRTALSFSGTQGGANPAAQTFDVTNTGGGTLSYTATENASWLTVAPASGSAPQAVTATVSTAGLAAGTYTAPVTVTAPGATGSPKTVDVTLVVSAPEPALSVTPGSLSFTATAGGANPAAQNLSVSNSGGGTLNWTATDDQTWLSVAPAGGTGAGTPAVSVNTAGLAAGSYTGTVTVTATGASGSPRTVPVTLTVNPATPALAVTPATMTFNATAGGANPAAQNLSVSNSGGGTLNWTASDDQAWLSVAPGSGTGAGTPSVSVSTAGLAAGTYTGTVTVTATGATGSPKTVAVTLNVAAATPVLSVTPASLTFNATAGGASPAAQTFSIANTGGGTLNWTASDNQTWLTVAPVSGTGAGTPSVTVSTAGLAAGTYTGTVT
ncbi:MAG: PQQ-dependent sugar dehydrogenase, partial [Thermoleophilaceae bacterium]|nr:PQQ-dependent sugar dehydrogenase [Thermoleophilaceae bacterium]